MADVEATHAPCPCEGGYRCETCVQALIALYHVAIAGRGLLDHLERDSPLAGIAAEHLREQLRVLEDITSIDPPTHAFGKADA